MPETVLTAWGPVELEDEPDPRAATVESRRAWLARVIAATGRPLMAWELKAMTWPLLTTAQIRYALRHEWFMVVQAGFDLTDAGRLAAEGRKADAGA